MIRLLQRIRKKRIEICCVGENGEHIWVSIFDLIAYVEDEAKKKIRESRNKD